MDTLIQGGTIVLPDREVRADIAVDGGRVAAIGAPGTLTAAQVIDATGRYVLPGPIDPHVHIGFGNGLADWETETRSAALGGITSLLSYLMSGESYLPVIAEAREAADRLSYIDYGFHLVPCAPVHLAEMARAVALGVPSFKYFTSFRGDEGAYLGITGTDDGFLAEYLQAVAGFPGAVANIHPENIEIVWKLRAALQAAGRDDLAAWDESRPDYVEAECILRTVYYAATFGCPVYTVHVSSAEALDAVRWMRRKSPDARQWAETCPHYLTHSKESPLGSLGKVNPPLRSPADREAIWGGILDGTIDTVGSDHVPRQRAKKQGTIWSASAGFPGTACILPVLLSEGVHRRGLSLRRVVGLTSTNPARIFGLAGKGSLDVGSDADLCIVDLDLARTVTPEMWGSYADYSLYDDWTLTGWPVLTMVRGSVVMRDGELVGQPGSGKFIRRPA